MKLLDNYPPIQPRELDLWKSNEITFIYKKDDGRWEALTEDKEELESLLESLDRLRNLVKKKLT